MPTLKPNFNPLNYIYVNSWFPRNHTGVRSAVGTLLQNLLVWPAPLKVDPAEAEVILQGNEKGLEVFLGAEHANYFHALVQELCAQYPFKHVKVNERGAFCISSENASPATIDEVHWEIGHLIVYICNTWKIASHNYLRDLYCATSGGESGIALEDSQKAALQTIFDRVHWAHHANDSFDNFRRYLKSTFIDYAEGVDTFQTLNATIHAMHLQATKPQVVATSTSSTSSTSKFRLIHDGDYFAELAKGLPGTIAISADNAFRPGGASIFGGKGSIEEWLCRTSNYLAKLTPTLAKQDPLYNILQGIMCRLKPTGEHIVLDKKSGLPPFLVGRKIDVYLSRDVITTFLSHVEKMALRAEYWAQNKNNPSYHQHKTVHQFATMTPGVSYQGDNNQVSSIDVIGMIGLDGRQPDTGKKLFGFASEYTIASEYFDKNGAFDLDKAGTEYAKRWHKVLQEALARNPSRIVLVAVGAGAFDPSNERYFTQASAEGFAKALMMPCPATNASGKQILLYEHIAQRNIEVIFPFKEKSDATHATAFELFSKAVRAKIPQDKANLFAFENDAPQQNAAASL